MDIRKGDLHIGGYRAQDVVDSYRAFHRGERALFLYSTEWARHNCRRLSDGLKGAQPFYACKALGLPEIIEVASTEGFGIDAVSPIEVELALKLGVQPRDIIMTYEASGLAMAYAASKGVTININSKAQLSDLIALGRRYGRCKNAGVMLRRNSAAEGAGWTDSTTTIGRDCKFGIREEDLVGEAKRANDAGLYVHGFHQHIGSGFGPESEGVFLAHARRLGELTAQALDEGIDEIDTIDYGGGFGIRYRESDRELDLAGLHSRVMEQQRKILQGADLRVIYEPGRMVADCGVMLMHVTRTAEEYIDFIRLNAGFTDFPRPAMYGAYQPVVPIVGTDRMPTRKVQLAGRLCESGDVFTTGKHDLRDMPDVKKGEWLALFPIPYGSAMRFKNYCQFPPPLDIIIDEKSVRPPENNWRQAATASSLVKPSLPEYFEALDGTAAEE